MNERESLFERVRSGLQDEVGRAERQAWEALDEIERLLTDAYNALGDCICHVDMRPDVQQLLDRLAQEWERSDA